MATEWESMAKKTPFQAGRETMRAVSLCGGGEIENVAASFHLPRQKLQAVSASYSRHQSARSARVKPIRRVEPGWRVHPAARWTHGQNAQQRSRALQETVASPKESGEASR